MITLAQLFGKWLGHPDATIERQQNGARLLEKANALLERAAADGVPLRTNPKTGTLISGTEYGGFRPQSCPQGAAGSSHKQGRGLDVYDPEGDLDDWLDDAKLEQFGLYREAPANTKGWTHLTDRAPGSGRRTFQP
jgi:hypothetical protein